MSPEATLLCLAIAFIAFVVCATISWPWRNATFLLGVGLAAWVFVPLWAAIEAI